MEGMGTVSHLSNRVGFHFRRVMGYKQWVMQA